MCSVGLRSAARAAHNTAAAALAAARPLGADPLAGSLRAADPSAPLRNFSPGPTSVPRAVMEAVARELTSWQGCGMSAMELSHRSPEFLAIKADTEAVLRRLIFPPAVSDDFELLFCHGGGHAQFAAAPLNLCGRPEATAHYFVTGTWSARAAAEAAKFCNVTQQGSAEGWWMPPEQLDLHLPDADEASFAYLCSNETVNGIEFFSLPAGIATAPLVVDMSSDFCSKPMDYSRVGVAFACAPKNIGIPGLTVVLVRKSLLRDRAAQTACPGVLDWALNAANQCLWNTPATFNIYVTGLVLNWNEEQGGLPEMETRARRKAELIYGAIDQSQGFYACPGYIEGGTAGAAARSRMNVPFEVRGAAGATAGDVTAADRLTQEFVLEAFDANIVGLRTNTPFGFGRFLRASLYNAVSVEDAAALADFMDTFRARRTL